MFPNKRDKGNSVFPTWELIVPKGGTDSSLHGNLWEQISEQAKGMPLFNRLLVREDYRNKVCFALEQENRKDERITRGYTTSGNFYWVKVKI